MNSNYMTDSIIIKSPGRINLIGEHLDYNGGYVFPGAINHNIILKFTKSQNNQCTIISEGFGSFSFNIQKPIKISSNQWENYILGVIHEINKIRPNKLKGFNCKITSTLPEGAGIASSAALECGVAEGLNQLFNLNLSDHDLVDISVKAEHNFVKNNCGIMDQFSIIKGKAEKLILLNCATLKFEFFQFEFDDYSIILLNSNAKHNLPESEYNDRRKECEQALEIIQKHHSYYDHLADVPENILDNLKDDLTEKLFKRAVFVTQENARVLESVTQLKKRELVKFGELMYESHDGLSKKYEVSSPELDFLVELTKDLPYVVGSRMMGGGFGGSTINIVEKKFINEFLSLACEKYKIKFNHNLISLEVEISDGVGRANFI